MPPLVRIFLLGTISSSVFAQGPLAPLDPPAPTMRTLEQIEPRLEVNATNTPGNANSLFIITSPGSYFLARNLTGETGKNGIRIAASGVALDLRGFEIHRSPGSGAGSGILVDDTRRNVTIRNGTIRNWVSDDSYGIKASAATEMVVEQIQVISNSVRGIDVGANSRVAHCTATGNGSAEGGAGIVAGQGSTISNCIASGVSGANGFGVSAGTGGVVIDCTVTGVTGSGGKGITVGGGGVIERCTARGNNGAGVTSALEAGSNALIIDSVAAGNTGATIGIRTISNTRISGCVSRLNGGDGIRSSEDCLITGNSVFNNGGHGIHTLIARNRIEGNTVTNNTMNGIKVDSINNLIIRNSAAANTAGDYEIAANNSAGPTVTKSTIAGNTNPHANYDLDAP